MGDHDAEHWDERYAAGQAHDHVHDDPNPELEALVAEVTPGRALDLGTGRGRHAIWLAQRGWRVVAVDFSAVGIDQARRRAAAAGVDVEWVVGDARTWSPAEEVFGGSTGGGAPVGSTSSSSPTCTWRQRRCSGRPPGCGQEDGCSSSGTPYAT